MSNFIKHVGVDGKGNKCIVVFRELPNDSDSALIVLTGALPTQYHDDLIAAVESVKAQETTNASEFLFRQKFKDGTNMLNTLHQKGWLNKVATKSVVMIPRSDIKINLAELNKQLKTINSKQTNTKAAAATPAAPAAPPGVLTDEALARKLRAQANTFEAESRRLREEADQLDPKGAKPKHLSVVEDQPAVKKSKGRPKKTADAAAGSGL